MGMHFKLGLYEHQSAGALQGMIDLLRKNPSLLSSKGTPGDRISKIVVRAYEPASESSATRTSATRTHGSPPTTPCSISSARNSGAHSKSPNANPGKSLDWKDLMLLPHDFDRPRSITR